MAEDPIPFDRHPPFGTSLLVRWGVGLLFAIPGLFLWFSAVVSLLGIAITDIAFESGLSLGVGAMGFALSAWLLCSVAYRVAALVSLRERRLLVLSGVVTVLWVASALVNFAPLLLGVPAWLASLVVVWGNRRGGRGPGSARAAA